MDEKIISEFLPKNYKIPKKDMFIVENLINRNIIHGNLRLKNVELEENDEKIITKCDIVSFSIL